MNLVLDSSALIAFLQNEPGYNVVRALMEDARNICYAHAINLCEVYYDFVRSSGKAAARNAINDILILGVIPREDMDTDFWQEVGLYKGTLRRISLADCFCLTLANRLDATLVTSDHHEFDQVDQQGICTVNFIR